MHMRARSFIPVLVLAACDSAKIDNKVIDVAPVPPIEQAAVSATPPPVPWRPCAEDRSSTAYDGNRWWGELTLCSGDLRIHLTMESTDLSGPNLTTRAQTATCSTVDKATVGESMTPSYFRLSHSKQLRRAKDVIRETVRKIAPECGGPFNADALLHERFDKRFAEFADKYWRYLSRAELEKVLSQREREAKRSQAAKQ